MVAYTKPKQRNKEESDWLRWERDQIKFIDIRLERWQVVGLSELCWGKAHGGLYKAPTKEERRKQKAKRRERSDQVEMMHSLKLT